MGGGELVPCHVVLRDYELMYIVRPELDEDRLKAATESVRTLVEGQGGVVVKSTPWGRRRLAYEVAHLRDGHYVLAEIRLDGGRVREVERALRIHDDVFRHLLVTREAAAEAVPGSGASTAVEDSVPPPAGDEVVVDEVALDEAPSALDEEEI